MCILHKFVNKFYLRSPLYDNTLNIWICLKFSHLFKDVVVGTLKQWSHFRGSQLKLLHHSGEVLGHQSNTTGRGYYCTGFMLTLNVSNGFRKSFDQVWGLFHITYLTSKISKENIADFYIRHWFGFKFYCEFWPKHFCSLSPWNSLDDS